MKTLKLPSNIIKHEAYVSRVIPFMEKPIAKVFTGQRRVGKSFMLFQIIQPVFCKKH